MTRKQKFYLGQTMITRNALCAVTQEEVIGALNRHLFGDWGSVDAREFRVNEQGVEDYGRLVSAYQSASSGKEFYVVTEWDRSLTTICLAEEFHCSAPI